MRSFNLPISGTILQDTARTFADKIGKKDFSASNGWLENFKKRHQLPFKILSGESAPADHEAAIDYQRKLGNICNGFNSENIFNCDETALFYRALPKKSLIEKCKNDCAGNKLS